MRRCCCCIAGADEDRIHTSKYKSFIIPLYHAYISLRPSLLYCISLPQFTGHFNSFSSPFYFHLQLFSVFEVSSVIMEIHIFLSLCTRNILRRRRRRISVVSQVEELQTETTSKWITTKGAKKNKPDHLFAALQPSCVGVLMMTIQPELKMI